MENIPKKEEAKQEEAKPKEASIFEELNILEIEEKKINNLTQDKEHKENYRGFYFGNPVVLKLYGEKSDSVINELKESFKVNFPGLSTYYGVMLKDGKNIYLVRDYTRGKLFYSVIDHDPYDRQALLYQAISSIEILHSYSMQYLTLSPDKVIISDMMETCLLDFIQNSNHIEHIKKGSFSSKYLFYHPRVITEEDIFKVSKEEREKFDIYSLGCFAFFATFGIHPRPKLISIEEIINEYNENPRLVFAVEEELTEEKRNILEICQKCVDGKYKDATELRIEWSQLPNVMDFIKTGDTKFNYENGRVIR